MATIVVHKDQQLPLDSIIEKVEYVKLGKTGDLLIGEITKVWITPTHIIVADRFQAQAIFIFDRQGEFQAVIDNLGRGPTEYLKISDVVLTPDKKRIAILDSYKMVLLYYDLRGTFLYKKKIPFLSSDIEYIDDENIVMLAYGMQPKDPGLANYDHKEDYVYLLDSTLYIKASAMHIPASIKKFEDRVYITPAWSDSIYRMTSDGRLSLRYRIDMTEIDGKANFGHESQEKAMEIFRTSSTFSNHYVDGRDFALFTVSIPPMDFRQVLFSKKTDKSYTVQTHSQRALNIYCLESSWVYENRFISAIPAFRFIADDSYAPMLGDELKKEIQKGLTDEDNPVLLFYTLKEPV